MLLALLLSLAVRALAQANASWPEVALGGSRAFLVHGTHAQHLTIKIPLRGANVSLVAVRATLALDNALPHLQPSAYVDRFVAPELNVSADCVHLLTHPTRNGSFDVRPLRVNNRVLDLHRKSLNSDPLDSGVPREFEGSAVDPLFGALLPWPVSDVRVDIAIPTRFPTPANHSVPVRFVLTVSAHAELATESELHGGGKLEASSEIRTVRYGEMLHTSLGFSSFIGASDVLVEICSLPYRVPIDVLNPLPFDERVYFPNISMAPVLVAHQFYRHNTTLMRPADMPLGEYRCRCPQIVQCIPSPTPPPKCTCLNRMESLQ